MSAPGASEITGKPLPTVFPRAAAVERVWSLRPETRLVLLADDICGLVAGYIARRWLVLGGAAAEHEILLFGGSAVQERLDITSGEPLPTALHEPMAKISLYKESVPVQFCISRSRRENKELCLHTRDGERTTSLLWANRVEELRGPSGEAFTYIDHFSRYVFHKRSIPASYCDLRHGQIAVTTYQQDAGGARTSLYKADSTSPSPAFRGDIETPRPVFVLSENSYLLLDQESAVVFDTRDGGYHWRAEMPGGLFPGVPPERHGEDLVRSSFQPAATLLEGMLLIERFDFAAWRWCLELNLRLPRLENNFALLDSCLCRSG